MLRMYECNWCFEKQVHDNGELKKMQAGDRMAFHHKAMCPFCSRFRHMRPMIKDSSSDWVLEDYTVRVPTIANMKVVPQIAWH